MKIAFILGAYSIGTRPLNFNNIWNNPRGLTGTEMCFIRTAQELKDLGHELHLFTVRTDQSSSFDGMHLYFFQDRFTIVDDTFDAVISMNEPNVFFEMNKKPKRIVWQMLNDFSYSKAGFDNEVDQYLGVCQQHTNYMREFTARPEKWNTVSLGCDPDQYTDKKVSGRVIWCSSADRGLHWLLSQWSHIKYAVPHASLRIFYHFNYGNIENIEQNQNEHPHVVEMAQRIRYMKRAITQLKHLGVEHVGSVSRNQMKEEFSQASVFAFSADTVAFSEGFSVSTLEAHASFTLPIITNCDCFGTIYPNSGCYMVPLPMKNSLSDFTELVIKGLKYENQERIEACRNFAKAHTWKESARQIQNVIQKIDTSKRTLC